MKKRKGEHGPGGDVGKVGREKRAADRAQRNEHVLLIINKGDGQDTPFIIPRFRQELSELQLGRGNSGARHGCIVLRCFGIITQKVVFQEQIKGFQ